MDRQDIDALLIGALYGELTPADEARLAAHLESHPADRGALDDLKSARAAVRESRIFDRQLEPPQAISALLLQEAHRRAPKRVVSDDNGERKESWFYRFTRVFMAHPAMAAATMLVLVVGVTGTLYMRKGDSGFVERKAAQAELAENSPSGASTPSSAGSAAPAEEPSPAAAPADDLNVADTGAADYGLAKQDKQQRAEPERRAVANGYADKYAVQLDETTAQRGRYDAAASDREQQQKKKSTSMVVTTPRPQPKEMDAPRAKASGGKGAVAMADLDAADSPSFAQPPASAAGPTVGGAGTATLSSGGAPAQAAPAPAAPPPPPSGGAMAPSATASKAPITAKPSAPAKSAPAREEKVAKDEKAAEKPADAKAEAAPAPAPATNSALMAWAKGEHSVTISLANKGDCVAAAKRAVQVQNRAPEYYAQYMATDRALKKCQVYIAQERDAELERANKTRATKRATTTDTK